MLSSSGGNWLFVGACLTAGLGCACAVETWLQSSRSNRRRRFCSPDSQWPDIAGTGMASMLVRYSAEVSRKISFSTDGSHSRETRATGRGERWLVEHAKKAGIEEAVSPRGFLEARRRVSVICGVSGVMIGSLFSWELAALLCVIGVVGGAIALKKAVLAVERRRADELERSLSEMLEVVALGLRSGLTFDRSFYLYGTYFDSALARACTRAQQRWTLGLMTREEALRDFAASYDSTVLARVVENVIRSLRFGSSLSESFEVAASDSRAAHRAQIEERVAKAPVKMMIPTGTLILPAMLLLVLGPVLLELMEGF